MDRAVEYICGAAQSNIIPVRYGAIMYYVHVHYKGVHLLARI